MHGKEGKISFPATLYELHGLIKTEGTVPFFSGRMYPERESLPGTEYQLPPEIISLDEVEELKRISRSETYIDCGSTVSFSALFNKAGHLLPPLLISTVKESFNPAVIGLTTPAGLLYSGRIPTPLSLLLNLFEVSYEVRRLRMHRWKGIRAANIWIYHNQLFKNGQIALDAGDVVLRMRIPANNWGQARIRRIGLGRDDLHIAMTADISRSYITNFRLSYALGGGEFFRDREREAHITGRTVSGSGKEVENLAREAVQKLGLGDDDRIGRAIYKCVRNFLYQKSETGA